MIAYIIHLVFLDNKRHIVLYLMKCAYPFEEENWIGIDEFAYVEIVSLQ